MSMTGIGITSTRPSILTHSLRAHAMLSASEELVVVKDSALRGVSWAKNRCLAALRQCEHVILIDEDVMPIRADWVAALRAAHEAHGQNVLMWMDHRHRARSDYGDLVSYARISGVMFSLLAPAIEDVGGWDEEYDYYFADFNFASRLANAGHMPLGPCSLRGIWSYLVAIDFLRYPPDWARNASSAVHNGRNYTPFEVAEARFRVDKHRVYRCPF